MERGTVPIPLKESRLVNCVLESTVSTDWMAALLSAPGVVSCSLGYYALVSAVDLIHLFSLILPSQMFVPLQFCWFASWKFVNFTRNFGWRCYFLFFTESPCLLGISFSFSLARIARCVSVRTGAHLLWAELCIVDCVGVAFWCFGQWVGWKSAVLFVGLCALSLKCFLFRDFFRFLLN